jgi:cyclic-di-AMP phosphodiesterase PgpH
MLADGVEAATRVLPDPTPTRVREVVESITRSRIEQGQMRDAPITMQQLELVKQEFVRILSAMRHTRIAYPGPDGVNADQSGTTPALAPT